MNLRESVLKKLAGTTGQNPVRLDDLRKVAEPICDDLQPLYDLMEKLYGEKIVNRVSGFKDGKQYVAYWLTGNTSGVCTPFRITTPAPPPRRLEERRIASPENTAKKILPIASKVQEKTAISPSPIKQEKTMSQEQAAKKSWLKDVTELVTKQPGIKRDDVVKQILLPDGSNRQSLLACISNGIYNKVLRLEENKGVETLYLGAKLTGSTKKPLAKPSIKKSKKAETKNTKPVAAPPHQLPLPATFDPGFSFAFGVRKDGGISIFKEGKTVSLSSSEVKTIIDHATA